jgi:hypothetical protein
MNNLYIPETNSRIQSLPLARVLLTVSQFCTKNPCWTESALRNVIFHATPRHSSKGKIPGNGLIEFGALLRFGRKILLDEHRFFAWLDARQDPKRFAALMAKARQDRAAFLAEIDAAD